MYFVLLAAAIAILVGVVVVAMGRGGEIVQSQRDLPLAPPQIRSASDVARLRLPIGLLGYREEATDEALDAAVRLIAEQEAEIARLREEVWRLRAHRNQDTQVDGRGIGAAAQDPPSAEEMASSEEKLPSPTRWEASRG
ncbi:MAG: hypothetical protein ACTHJW_11125 [Streptosporangiaceae bacterium]